MVEGVFAASGIEDMIANWFSWIFELGDDSGRGLGGAAKGLIGGGERGDKPSNPIYTASVDSLDFDAFSGLNFFGSEEAVEFEDSFSETLSNFSTAFGGELEGVVGQGGFLGGLASVLGKGIQGFGSVLSSLGSMIGGLFSSGGGGGFGQLLSIGAAIFRGGFATGGYVSGPGTGTSDSIMALLSNGEYVVNAKATKMARPLLEAINAGKLPKFATGGIVGGGITSANVSTLPNNAIDSTVGQTSVFNINITGDVSEQTKKEIYKMLPQIASGVNNFNRERNISRR